MSLKHCPESGRGASPPGASAGVSKPATTTAPHSQLTGAGDPSPPPGTATPRFIDDKDIRVLNNLLDDLKKLDNYQGEERVELGVTSRRGSAAGEDLLEASDGDVLLEPKGGRTEQKLGQIITKTQGNTNCGIRDGARGPSHIPAQHIKQCLTDEWKNVGEKKREADSEN
ncbi:uncharacterized protein [Periplaneta americana]|uniref:uncharacterized protein n=1 Tax=Periplaneta americana TaxID=6978 RepID=UPI0037E7D355